MNDKLIVILNFYFIINNYKTLTYKNLILIIQFLKNILMISGLINFKI